MEKTQLRAGYQAATPQQPIPASTSPQRSSSSSGSSTWPVAFPGTSGFGRAALALADDLVGLFDPFDQLIGSPRPVSERSVRVVSQPRTLPQLQSQPQPKPAGRKAVDLDLSEAHFRSEAKSTAVAFASPGGIHVVDPDDAHLIFHSTIPAANADALTDRLTPVTGANERLALLMMPPSVFCGFTFNPAAWRVSQLRTYLNDGEWTAAAQRTRAHSPQRAVALALASCPIRESKSSWVKPAQARADWRMDSLIVDPRTTVPASAMSMAREVFPHLRATAVIGSTFHAAETGTPMNCQDGVYLSPHATVVTDGLGGHGGDAVRVRLAQLATGQLVTHLIETIARTEARPAEFLRLHLHALLQLLDEAVASALVAPYPEKDRAQNVGEVPARAAFVAVAHLQDGTVAFGVGDCTAHLLAREPDGRLRVETFTPQPGDVDPMDVGGLGDRSLVEGQFGIRPFPPGVVQRVVAGSDGVFDAHHGHLELVEGRASTSQVGRARVGKQELAELTPTDACEEIVTRLTQRTRQFWESQAGSARRDTTGLDDVALVVRDLSDPAQAGGTRQGAKDRKNG